MDRPIKMRGRQLAGQFDHSESSYMPARLELSRGPFRTRRHPRGPRSHLLCWHRHSLFGSGRAERVCPFHPQTYCLIYLFVMSSDDYEEGRVSAFTSPPPFLERPACIKHSFIDHLSNFVLNSPCFIPVGKGSFGEVKVATLRSSGVIHALKRIELDHLPEAELNAISKEVCPILHSTIISE